MAVSTIYAIIFSFLLLKPNPDGLNYQSNLQPVTDLKFHVDLTYEQNGSSISEQEIFSEVFSQIDQAQEFIIMDMFLFHDQINMPDHLIPIASKIMDKLIQKKEALPSMTITIITDPLNSNYRSLEVESFERLKNAGITIIETDLRKCRDSNPIYTVVWRTLFQWFTTKGSGWLANITDPNGEDVTLRAYLELLNFKANHRKIMLTEKRALISSANPHGPSSRHSNIAFSFSGPILNDIEASETAVLNFSGSEWPGFIQESNSHTSSTNIQLLTEKKIQSSLIDSIDSCSEEDSIDIAMFYLSSRKIVHSLLKAAKRGTNIRLILDANKDAFGRIKDGVPNRPVATELVKKSNQAITVRWYKTHGEQFHTKLIVIKKQNQFEIFAGSANLTRRNINNYNLESNIKLVLDQEHAISKEVDLYFDRIWFNQGAEFTVNYEKYKNTSRWKTIKYRIQEFTGLGTF